MRKGGIKITLEPCGEIDTRGNVLSEVFGGPDTKPAIAQSHEVF